MNRDSPVRQAIGKATKYEPPNISKYDYPVMKKQKTSQAPCTPVAQSSSAPVKCQSSHIEGDISQTSCSAPAIPTSHSPPGQPSHSAPAIPTPHSPSQILG